MATSIVFFSFLWECLELLDFLFLCEFDEADLEGDEEDDLCLLFFLDLCLLLDWSLRDGLVCEEYCHLISKY